MGARHIDVRVVLDWREHARLLKLRFAARLESPVATYEIPYGAIERPANGEEEPGQRWIDVSGRLPAEEAAGAGAGEVVGLAVLNDAKYGFDIFEGELGVTAVRSPIHEPATPQPNVRYQFQDQGQQRFTLRLVPHLGAWSEAGLTRLAAELNQRPTVLLESFHDGPLPRTASHLAVSPGNVVAGSVKLAEDGDDLVVRLVETAGIETEASIELPGRRGTIGTRLGPFQIRTFRVPREAAADFVEVDLLERPVAAAAPVT
jgi:alpha-mannosidase